MLRRNHLSPRDIRCDLFSVESLASAQFLAPDPEYGEALIAMGCKLGHFSDSSSRR
jgi:hypothetical protein